MYETLLKILEHGLSIWDSKEGKSFYNAYLKAKKKRDEQMDKKARGLKYSQLAVDRSMREIADIAEAYAKFIGANPTIK